MSKQTAVEWLQEQLNPDMKTMQGNIIQDLLEQALAIEKEQMEQAKSEGYEFATQEAIKEIHKNYRPL